MFRSSTVVPRTGTRSAGRLFASCLLALTALVAPAWAQGTVAPATVSVSVTDPTGAAVTDMTLVLVNRDTRVERSAAVTPAGDATFDAVRPGRYDITAARAGFAPAAIRDVEVRPGDSLRLALALKVSGVSEFVEVTSPARYVVARTEAGTKTDTPLLETPVSVQIVPQAIIADRQLTSLPEVVNGQVSGVVGRTGGGTLYDNFIIRGFSGSGFGDAYRNGLYNRQDIYDIANIERVEVLKGPAAVLYGRIEPGGLINYVTKKPMATPRYALQQQLGSDQQFRTLVDATGPVAGNAQVLYRVNASYLTSQSFRDYVSTARGFVAPSLTWKPSARFDITVELEHKRDNFQPDIGIPSIGSSPAPLPIARSVADGERTQTLKNTLVAANWTYRIGKGWSLTQRYQRQNWALAHDQVLAGALQANNTTQNRNVLKGTQNVDTDSTNVDLLGRVSTGVLKHTLLLGLDHFWARTASTRFFGAVAPINILAPSYGIVNWASLTANSAFYRKEAWTGFYVQDQVSIADRLHVLAGGRYDSVETGSAAASTPSVDAARANRLALTDSQFSPRLAVLYRAHRSVSLYTSYSKSFGANNGLSVSGEAFDPQQGRQYEVGVKAETADKRLSSSVAWFDLTKDNMLTADPLNPAFQILAGEARSTGVEVDLSGQVSNRLTMLATYANTDARYTKNNNGLQGNRLENVPRNQGSLWGTMDVTSQLRAGLGVIVVGQRLGDQANSLRFDGYTRVDLMAAWDRPLGRSLLTLQVNINNLLDAGYFTSGGSRNSVVPGRPRNALASVRVAF